MLRNYALACIYYIPSSKDVSKIDQLDLPSLLEIKLNSQDLICLYKLCQKNDKLSKETFTLFLKTFEIAFQENFDIHKAQDKIEIYIKGKKRPNFAFYQFVAITLIQ